MVGVTSTPPPVVVTFPNLLDLRHANSATLTVRRAKPAVTRHMPGHTTRDRSYKGPVTVDARTNPSIYSEVCKNEMKYFWNAKTPKELEAARGGNEKEAIKSTREQLTLASADYLWSVEAMAAPSAAPPAKTSAMAELAMGVPDAETAYLRQKPGADAVRTAVTSQVPTVMPWHIGVTDPCFVSPHALANWKARENANLLRLPPMPKPTERVHATVAGSHAHAVEMWRGAGVPLSQWELSARGDALVEANKLAESLAAQRGRAKLAELLQVTHRASKGRSRWFERGGLPAQDFGLGAREARA